MSTWEQTKVKLEQPSDFTPKPQFEPQIETHQLQHTKPFGGNPTPQNSAPQSPPQNSPLHKNEPIYISEYSSEEELPPETHVRQIWPPPQNSAPQKNEPIYISEYSSEEELPPQNSASQSPLYDREERIRLLQQIDKTNDINKLEQMLNSQDFDIKSLKDMIGAKIQRLKNPRKQLYISSESSSQNSPPQSPQSSSSPSPPLLSPAETSEEELSSSPQSSSYNPSPQSSTETSDVEFTAPTQSRLWPPPPSAGETSLFPPWQNTPPPPPPWQPQSSSLSSSQSSPPQSPVPSTQNPLLKMIDRTNDIYQLQQIHDSVSADRVDVKKRINDKIKRLQMNKNQSPSSSPEWQNLSPQPTLPPGFTNISPPMSPRPPDRHPSPDYPVPPKKGIVHPRVFADYVDEINATNDTMKLQFLATQIPNILLRKIVLGKIQQIKNHEKTQPINIHDILNELYEETILRIDPEFYKNIPHDDPQKWTPVRNPTECRVYKWLSRFAHGHNFDIGLIIAALAQELGLPVYDYHKYDLGRQMSWFYMYMNYIQEYLSIANGEYVYIDLPNMYFKLDKKLWEKTPPDEYPPF